MRVLVLGAGGSAGYNFIEAIRPDVADHTIVGTDVDAASLTLAPCTTKRLATHIGDPARYDEIVDIIETHDIDVVHAQPDIEVEWLATHQHDLPARTLVPDVETVRICQDKLTTAQILGELAPRSYNVSAGAFERALHGEAWMRLRRGAGSMGALPVRDWNMIEAWLAHWQRDRGYFADEWMLAELLPGRDLSWTGIYHDATLVASACKERVALMGAHCHPANIASTATVQTIVARPDVNEICEEAVRRLDPDARGVWMVDLRENADGEPKVTEVNCGRFGTTSLFWAHAGGNLPLAYLHLASGRGYRDDTPPLRDACQLGATWVRKADMGYALVPRSVLA